MLNHWLEELQVWNLLAVQRKCTNLMRNKILASEVAKRISLQDISKSIEEYTKDMSAGKHIIYPNRPIGEASWGARA